MPRDIRSLTREELAGLFEEWKQPGYRVDQLLHWLHARRAVHWGTMTNLPKALRQQLSAHFLLQPLELFHKQGSRDSTQKFLWRLSDGAFVESVLIPANPALYGEASDRHTLCVSTQVGCAYGCKFCASGLDGWKRNLTAAEIIDQVYGVERWNAGESQSGAQPPTEHATRNTPEAPRLINNLVIMGMGEPLANYDHLLAALRILNAPWGGGIGARKITVSTSGLAPQIRKLADDPMQLRLAVSLHGATDAVRERLMPVNRKYPLKELLAACDYYQKRKGRMITFEYILIAGVNDSLDQAPPLAELSKRLHAKVNLIPYNTVEGLPWHRPAESVCQAFVTALERRGVTATLRREKGHDIDAACGQLRLRTERGTQATQG
ncbi:MAG: 23S rRNA (adenine(2503)-C(2))-methyltransferase RlmN [Verrucomicrobia bacterium]|nr:23S rRNA (adenine(2503)-C(2))-methyltransferase RlmN [Verrucomicrobiota bacterium]